ncbi:MAG: hypothetical protein WDO13_19000 [Verrucomicrobiota bacterium]
MATLVSLDPIYLNFDMSEADYMMFLRERERQKQKGAIADQVDVSLSDETAFTHEGTLDFIDNSLDRSSGTIHARATIPNSDLPPDTRRFCTHPLCGGAGRRLRCWCPMPLS